VIRLFRGPRGVTLGQVAGVLLLFGSAVGIAWYALGAIEYEMVNHNGLDRAALASFLHKADNPNILVPVFLLFLVGIVLGSILLGIAAWRVRVVPIWAAVLILLAGPIGFFANSHAGSIVDFVVLLAGLGTLGWTVLAMSDEEWDAPRERKAPPAQAPPAPAPTPAA
jgi:hypothetical protein